MESGLWLCPMEDRRGHGESRVGLLDSFSLGSYLLLVDATSRLFRSVKGCSDLAATALATTLRHSRRLGIIPALTFCADRALKAPDRIAAASYDMTDPFCTSRFLLW